MSLLNDLNHADIGGIARYGAVVVPRVLQEETRLALLEESKRCEWVEMPGVVGFHKVRQEYTAVVSFRPGNMFGALRDECESSLQRVFDQCDPAPLRTRIVFNDMRLQTYAPDSVGITVHRDFDTVHNLVVLFVLENGGRFCVCDDREHTNERHLKTEAGDLILMRARGFLGADIQPFHFVDRVCDRRTTFCLRRICMPEKTQ